MSRWTAFGIVLLVAAGSAHADPAVSSLSNALPSGWKLVVTPNQLLIWHPAPVRIAGTYSPWTPHMGNMPVMASPESDEITLLLRYRIEPAWSEQQYATARAANASVYRELVDLRARYRIDEIHAGHGRLLPANPDEEQRASTFEREYARALTRLVSLPRCTLGTSSLFDDPTTTKLLDLMVDPPGAMREAYAIVELVKRRCR